MGRLAVIFKNRVVWGILISAAFARAAIGFQFQSLPALAPALGSTLGLELKDVGILTGAYMLPGVLIALLAGAILQRASGRSVILAGLALVACSGFLASTSAGFNGVLASRLVGGVGGVFVTVATLKGIFDLFSPSELPLANGAVSGSQPFGMGCALFVFSAQGQGASWEMGMFATSAVAVLAFILVWKLFSTGKPVLLERRYSPARQIDQIGWIKLLLAGLTIMLFVGCFFAFLSLFPSFLHAAGWNATDAGLALGALGWAPIVMGPLGGFIAFRIGRPTLMAAICIAAWGLAVAVTAIQGPAFWLIFVMVIFGPLPIGVVMSTAARAVNAEAHGIASGISMALMFFGMSAIPAVAPWAGDFFATTPDAQLSAAILFCGISFLLSLLPLSAFEWLSTLKN
jgi:predicted MFS family arabinose efflux permease